MSSRCQIVILHLAQKLYDIAGGYEYDGKTEMSAESVQETQDAVQDALKKCIASFVISGVFSPIRGNQELEVRDIVEDACHSGSLPVRKSTH